MLSIEEFIETTNSASTPEEVFHLFQDALCSLGFDRVVYSLITDHLSMNKKAGHGIMKNYPDDWMQHYSESNYEQIDPVPKYAFLTNKPFLWDTLVKEKELTEIEKKVMDEATEAKFLDGVGIPIYGPNGEIAGIGLASSLGGIKPDINLLSKLRAISFQFHIAYSEHDMPENNVRNIHLTNREKEVLLWCAEGKSDTVIGDILGISHNSVRFHLKNIYKKLDANEKTFAVVKALKYGLISPSFVEPY